MTRRRDQLGAYGAYTLACFHGAGACAAPMELQLAAWQFMRDHPFGADSSYAQGVPGLFPSYCH